MDSKDTLKVEGDSLGYFQMQRCIRSRLTTKLSYPDPMIKLWSDVGGEAGRSCEGVAAVGCTAWMGPITLNVAHESPTKSSAR